MLAMWKAIMTAWVLEHMLACMKASKWEFSLVCKFAMSKAIMTASDWDHVLAMWTAMMTASNWEHMLACMKGSS